MSGIPGVGDHYHYYQHYGSDKNPHVKRNFNSTRQLGRRASHGASNYQKSCPGCDRFWKFCKCSNIKERPDPQPYCKFVPPRLQIKAKKSAV